MAKLIVEEAKDYSVLPEDTIVGIEVEDITEREVPGVGGHEGWTKLEFKTVIRELPTHLAEVAEYRELLDTTLWGSVSMRLTQHPDNKLRQWAEALLDMGPLPVGFELDTDMLKRRRGRAVVGHYTKRGSTSPRMRINAILPPAPMGSGSGRPAAPAWTPTPAQPSQSPPQPPPPQPAPWSTPAASTGSSWDDDEPPF